MADSLHEAPAAAARGPRPPKGKRPLTRVGVVDVGSNSVRLVVYEALSRSPAYFFNEKVLCGLGAELTETGRLAPKGRERALAALRRFAALAERMRVDALDGVATAAVREASDGAEFVEEVAAKTGIRLRVASGEDEARLAAQGVLMGWPDAEGVVADLGGASMELARVGNGVVTGGMTLPLGPLRLAGLKDAAAQDAEIERALEGAGEILGAPGGGSTSWAAPGGRSPRSTWRGSTTPSRCCTSSSFRPTRCWRSRTRWRP